MSQKAFLRAFDEHAFGGFFNAGLADRALYIGPDQPPGALGVGCTVLVDRGVQDFGTDLAPVSADATVVTLQHSEIPNPDVGGEIVLLDDDGMPAGDVFKLYRRLKRDESSSRYEVTHVTA